MEETTKHKVMMGVGVGMLIIAAFFLVLILKQKKNIVTVPKQVVSEEDVEEPAPSEEEPVEQPVEKPATTDTILAVDTPDLQLKRVTMDFVARFGTFSTDGKGENLKLLLPAMNVALRNWAEKQIAIPPVYVQFQSYTTRALSAQIVSNGGGSAHVRVSAQRAIKNGSVAKPTLVYDKADVTLEKDGDTWLVNEVVWGAK